MSDLVDLEIRDHVAIISMRREAKRNAIDRQLADAIDEALNRLEDEPGSEVDRDGVGVGVFREVDAGVAVHATRSVAWWFDAWTPSRGPSARVMTASYRSLIRDVR